MHRSPCRPRRATMVIVLALLAACSDDSGGPSEPALVLSSITAGGSETCGTTPDGALVCWSTASWGDGGVIPEIVPATVGLTVQGADLAHSLRCVRTADGDASCWGSYLVYDMEYGAGPAGVAADLPGTVVDVAAAATHACVLLADGAAHCFGANFLGQLGMGPVADLANPLDEVSEDFVAVTGSPPLFQQIVAGGVHSCALAMSGAAYCWGSNRWGELGTTATLSECLGGWMRCAFTPVQVAGNTLWEQLAAGSEHTCAIHVDGRVYCWGNNSYRQLGVEDAGSVCSYLDADLPCALTPVPVPLPEHLTFISVTAGGEHSCAVASNGTAYCWGNATRGRLGASEIATVECRFDARCAREPVRVPGGSWAAISAGGNHTCALTTDGETYCWGADAATTPEPVQELAEAAG